MSNPLIVAPRTKTVHLYPGGVEESLDDLREKLDEALNAEASPRRMAEKSPADRLAREYDAKAKSAAENRVDVVLSEVSARAYRRLQDENPPCKGNKRDESLGFNEETFLRDLVQAALVSPEVTDEQFVEFADSVTEFNWRKLTSTAWELANQEADLPKPLAVSLLRRIRERESKQPVGTE